MAGLYIHIPFCHSKCAYCDFYSSPSAAALSRVRDLAGCVVREFGMRAGETAQPPIDTIYIGGGTPSILPHSTLASLVGGIRAEAETRGWRFGPSEFTIEANPEDITKDKCLMMRDLGINRVSMGVQALDDGLLTTLGRRHDVAAALDAIDTIASTGFGNYSLDLIYGIPGQTLESWQMTLERMMRIRPPHLSAYILTYEPHTRITAMARSGKIEPVDDDTVARMYTMLCDAARDAGYRHYEISNFALPGYEAVHNSSYWTGTPYIGLGPGAHSFDGRSRRVNAPDLNDYIDCISRGELACTVERESRFDIFNDLVVTALRTDRGLALEDVNAGRRRKFLCDVWQHLRRGTVVLESGRFVIPEDRWIVSDDIISDLLQVK